MVVNLAAIAQLIQFARIQGQVPAEIHASKATIEAVVASAPKYPDTRSPLQRMMGAALPEPVRKNSIMGLPFVENPKVADGAIALRLQSSMDNPDWLNSVERQQEPSTPWLERTELAQGEAVEDSPTLSTLATSTGRVAPSDVLIKAFDGIEKVDHVIVIRCMSGGNMEMSGSLDRMAMMGALQIAMSYVMGGQ